MGRVVKIVLNDGTVYEFVNGEHITMGDQVFIVEQGQNTYWFPYASVKVMIRTPKEEVNE